MYNQIRENNTEKVYNACGIETEKLLLNCSITKIFMFLFFLNYLPPFEVLLQQLHYNGPFDSSLYKRHFSSLYLTPICITVGSIPDKHNRVPFVRKSLINGYVQIV